MRLSEELVVLMAQELHRRILAAYVPSAPRTDRLAVWFCLPLHSRHITGRDRGNADRALSLAHRSRLASAVGVAVHE